MGTLTRPLSRALAFGLGILVLGFTAGFAQSFSVYNVNASAFPKVTASYVAFDQAGNPYTNLTTADFTAVENVVGAGTTTVTPTLKQSCVDIPGDPAASIVLVVDESNSMSDIVPATGRTRLDYVKDALKAFVGRLKFGTGTQVCMIGFSGVVREACPWTATLKQLTDSIDKLKPVSATNYKLPFQGSPNVFYELRMRDPAIPKFVFFLTDGKPNPAIDSIPSFIKKTTDSAQAQGIRIYSVTVLETNTDPTLSQICLNTGGKNIVTTEDKLIDIYSLLALETQLRRVCTLEWTAPYACAEAGRDRSIAITLKKGLGVTATVPYTAPANAVAKVGLSDNVVYCGDPTPLGTQTATVTITASNAPLTVTNFSVMPTTQYFNVQDWDGSAPPFTLAIGQSRKITILFTQGATRQFRSGTLVLNSLPCPQSISLVGGVGQVQLKSLRGGKAEIHSTCDTLLIKWAGVTPTTPVKLEYSDDDGKTWKLIAPAATGLSYLWLAPKAGNQYRIRTSVAPVPTYSWAQQIGANGSDTASSVAVLGSGLKVYATGWYDGNTQFGTANGTTFTAGPVTNPTGNIDGYVQEFDGDGTFLRTMLLTGTGTNVEKVIGAVTDKEGSTYIAGFYQSPTAEFAINTLGQRFTFPLGQGAGSKDASNMFIVKLDPTGNFAWYQLGQGSNLYKSTTDASKLGIRYNASTGAPEIIVAGRTVGYIRVGSYRSNTYAEQKFSDNNPRSYYAVYDKDGYVVNNGLQIAGPPADPGITWADTVATDASGCRYETGKFKGTKNFGTPPVFTFNSNGTNTDTWVSKFCAAPASADSSDSAFQVQSPLLVANPTTLTADNTIVGQSSTQSASNIVCNASQIPVVIKGYTITPPGEFTLSSTIIGTRLAKQGDPTACFGFEIIFAPTGTGNRTAVLQIDGDCNTSTSITLNGKGLPPCNVQATASVDMGNVVMGTTPSKVINCPLRNNSPDSILVSVAVTPANPEFDVNPKGPFKVAPGACYPDITVSMAPSTPGVKSATLVYTLPTDCGSASTSVTAEVFAPNVIIETVPLGKRRVGTNNDTVIYIQNLSSQLATITNVTVSAPDPNFINIVLPGTPFDLQPGDKKAITLRYTPLSRGPQEVKITAVVQGQAAAITGGANGIGILPSIVVTDYSFNAWPVGSASTENGFVTIRNTDDVAPLHIESVAWVNGGQADFTPNPIVVAPLPPTDIAPLDSIRIPVTFFPKSGGMHIEKIRVMHDAKPGPESIPPYSESLATVRGEGLQASSIDPIDFGNVLTCETVTKTFEIQNPSTTEAFIITSVVGTGDTRVITLSPMNPPPIAPGDKIQFTVTFAPDAAQNFVATYTFANSVDPNLNVRVSGTGITSPLSLTLDRSASGTVGSTIGVPITLSYPLPRTNKFSDIDITITYPADALRYDTVYSSPQNADWTFSVLSDVPGTLVLNGKKAAGGTINNAVFLTPAFNVYLNGDQTLSLTLTCNAKLPCITTNTDQSQISVTKVCFTEGRIVKFGTFGFGFDPPYPNPSTDILTIPYATGFEVVTTFEVFDQMGSLIDSYVTSAQQSGKYELDLNTSRFANGMYFLRMTSGPYSATSTFSVVK